MICLTKELLQTDLCLDKLTQVFVTSSYENCGLFLTSASIRNYELQLEYIIANNPF